MARTIWKTHLSLGVSEYQLPAGAQPLSIHMQNGKPKMWSVVDDDHILEMKAILITGTGQLLPDDLGNFIGTVLSLDQTFVFHVFERYAPPRYFGENRSEKQEAAKVGYDK